MIDSRYYTIEEAAELLRVSYDTIRRACASGKLFSIQIGRVRRIPESAVDAWLNGDSADSTLEASVIPFERRA